jgi:hypothetical protein
MCVGEECVGDDNGVIVSPKGTTHPLSELVDDCVQKLYRIFRVPQALSYSARVPCSSYRIDRHAYRVRVQPRCVVTAV